MNKATYLLALPILIVGVVLYRNHQEQEQIQEDWLNRLYFQKVQPQGEQVLFTPSLRGVPIQVAKKSFDAPVRLGVGDTFHRGDEHFAVDYAISRIDEDGVVISYDATGGEPGPIGWSSGSVKLLWK